jgi:ABC-type proline/glycine betaine transport system ATPase subunit
MDWTLAVEATCGTSCATWSRLTTQYLEEADQLADDIVIMDRGRIIADRTPLQLKQHGAR